MNYGVYARIRTAIEDGEIETGKSKLVFPFCIKTNLYLEIQKSNTAYYRDFGAPSEAPAVAPSGIAAYPPLGVGTGLGGPPISRDSEPSGSKYVFREPRKYTFIKFEESHNPLKSYNNFS